MPFITIEGENKIALQQGNAALLDISHFVLANIAGLGAEPADRIETLPIAGDIVDTRVVTKNGYVNTNQVVYSLTLDSSIGDYSFNWVGLKDADGVLIACTYLADPITKTATNGGIDGNNLIRNFLLQYSGIQATTAISAPADTWQIDFTTRLLQVDERERLSNFDIYGHDAFFEGGMVTTLNAGTVYDVSVGVGYVGGIRCEFTNPQSIDVVTLPSAVYVDASLQGDLTGLTELVTLTASASVLADYVDANGIQHYVAKIADISAGGVVTINKVRTDLVFDHEAKADPHAQYLKHADSYLSNCNQVTKSSINYFDASSTNKPGTTYGSILTLSISPDKYTQHAIGNDNVIYTRAYNGATWTAWAESFSAHAALSDPHTQYLAKTQLSDSVTSTSSTTPSTSKAAKTAYDKAANAQTNLNTHAAAADPHAQYLKHADSYLSNCDQVTKSSINYFDASSTNKPGTTYGSILTLSISPDKYTQHAIGNDNVIYTRAYGGATWTAWVNSGGTLTQGTNGTDVSQSGKIQQWGRSTVSIAPGGVLNIPFNIAFPTEVGYVGVSIVGTSPDNGLLTPQVVATSLSNIQITNLDIDSTITDLRWFATGY